MLKHEHISFAKNPAKSVQIFLAWDWSEPEHRISFHFLFKCKPTEPVCFLFWIQGTHWFFGQCVRLFSFHKKKTLKAIQLLHLYGSKSLSMPVVFCWLSWQRKINVCNKTMKGRFLNTGILQWTDIWSAELFKIFTYYALVPTKCTICTYTLCPKPTKDLPQRKYFFAI